MGAFTYWSSCVSSYHTTLFHATPSSEKEGISRSISKPIPVITYIHNDHDEHDEYELVINHSVSKLPIISALILVNFLSLCSGYIWYLSLSQTVAAINNTIFQSNCVGVLIFSYFILNEQLNWKKVVAAIIAIIGVILISFSSPSSSDKTSSILGIILCVVAMTVFSLFEVLFKYFGHKYFRFGYELSDTLLFQSGIGLMNLLLFWPFIIILHYTEFESFGLPSNYEELINGLLLPCFLDFLFTSSLLCGITLCGPIFMSIGLILVIPISFFCDIIIFQKEPISIINIESIAGACCIIIGFILIQLSHAQKIK